MAMAREPCRKITAILFIAMTALKFVAPHKEYEPPQVVRVAPSVERVAPQVESLQKATNELSASKEGPQIEAKSAGSHRSENQRQKRQTRHKREFEGLPIEFDNLQEIVKVTERQYEGLPIEFDNLQEIEKANENLAPKSKLKVPATQRPKHKNHRGIRTANEIVAPEDKHVLPKEQFEGLAIAFEKHDIEKPYETAAHKHKQKIMSERQRFENFREIEISNEIDAHKQKQKRMSKRKEFENFRGTEKPYEIVAPEHEQKILAEKQAFENLQAIEKLNKISPKISLLLEGPAAMPFAYQGDIQEQHKGNPKGQFVELPIQFDTLHGIKKDNENTTLKIMTTKRVTIDRRFRRIYNPDEVASIEEFPYMAALLVNQALWCGAVIIDRDKVLTAAHCLQLQYNNRFFREYVKMLTVRVGSTNATSGGEVLRVTEIYFHPNYKPQTLEFNYAVLKLHKNMSFGKTEPYIEKIKYSRDQVVPVDNKIMFLGWGSVLGIDGAGGTDLLQKVTLPVYDTADCQEVYGKELVTRTNFCAGFITIPKNVCNHDAGGPAVMNGILMGVLSFSSKRCDQADQPAVFSNVGSVANWLDSVGNKKVVARKLMQ